MPKLVILGTANAIPDEDHENTHMAVSGQEHLLLVDCVGNPVVRLRQAGLDMLNLTEIILTHFHPDHVSGVPSLLMSSWLLGRTRPLDIYGLAYTLDRMEKLMEFYDWHSWPDFFPVHFHRLPAEEKVLAFENAEMRVFTSPVRHLIPAIGLRIEFPKTQKTIAYSCDTEPCQEVVRLASGADLLIHEAAGASSGHTAPIKAGEIARQAEVSSLYLIHYRTSGIDTAALVEEACKTYPGPVTLAKDFMQISF